MNINTNNLAYLREAAKIKLQDLAYLIGTNQNHLKKIEMGNLEVSVTFILIYHMLFKASLEDMFTDLYAHLHAQLFERSETLIAHLNKRQSPKSIYRIKAISKIVNSLNHDSYECVN